jgi:hypothetical protein
MAESLWNGAQGDNDSCKCENYTNPSPRSNHEGWRAAHESNKEKVANCKPQYDTFGILFLGDNLVENMNGLEYNWAIADREQITTGFNNTFLNEDDGNINGIALGIAGDSVRLPRTRSNDVAQLDYHANTYMCFALVLDHWITGSGVQCTVENGQRRTAGVGRCVGVLARVGYE